MQLCYGIGSNAYLAQRVERQVQQCASRRSVKTLASLESEVCEAIIQLTGRVIYHAR